MLAPGAPRALAVLLFSAMWTRFIDEMIFQPSGDPGVCPAALGVDAEEVHLRTEDGVRIHAY